MTAFIDPVSGVVSIVDTVITRVEAHKKELAERNDVRDALLDLLHLLREWSTAALATNQALARWVEERGGSATGLALGRAMFQFDVVQDVARRFGKPGTVELPDRRRAQATLSDLFFAYAPDLEEGFAQVAERRLELLEDAQADLRAAGADRSALRRVVAAVFPGAALRHNEIDVDLDALNTSAHELDRLARRVADFIRQNFKPGDLTVEPQR